MNASIDVLTLFLFNIVLVNIPLLYGTVGEIVTGCKIRVPEDENG